MSGQAAPKITPEPTTGAPRLEAPAAGAAPQAAPAPGTPPPTAPGIPEPFAPPVTPEPTGWTPEAAVETAIALHNAGMLGWALAGNPAHVVEKWKRDNSALAPAGPQLAHFAEVCRIPPPGGEGMGSAIVDSVVALGALAALEFGAYRDVKKAQERHRLTQQAGPAQRTEQAGTPPAAEPAAAAPARPTVIPGGAPDRPPAKREPSAGRGWHFNPQEAAVLAQQPDRGREQYMEASRPL